MKWLVGGLLLAITTSLAALPTVVIDRAVVTIEKRSGVDWCVLDSQVSGEAPTSLDRLLAVVQNYPAYPKLFPSIREVSVTKDDGAVLLSETVEVSALGIVNINRFTLRLITEEIASPKGVKVSWSQERTDGSIDSLSGGWQFEDRGTAQAPMVRVTYRTKSAVPVKVPGQEVVIRMFLGNEVKGILEAVFKAALSR